MEVFGPRPRRDFTSPLPFWTGFSVVSTGVGYQAAKKSSETEWMGTLTGQGARGVRVELGAFLFAMHLSHCTLRLVCVSFSLGKVF